MYVWVIGVHPHQPKIIQVVIEKLASGFHEENYDAKMKQTKGKAYIKCRDHTPKSPRPQGKNARCVCVCFSRGDPTPFLKNKSRAKLDHSDHLYLQVTSQNIV